MFGKLIKDTLIINIALHIHNYSINGKCASLYTNVIHILKMAKNVHTSIDTLSRFQGNIFT